MLVYDVRQDLEPIQAMLSLSGYEVLVACDGEQALNRVKEESPDFVLLAAMTPKLDGYKICSQLKADEETRLLPVILFIPRGEDKIRAIEAGSDGFLEMPLRRVELLARVKTLVRVKQLNDELISLRNAIYALAAAIESKDPYTEGHLERVSAYALSLGREVGLSPRELRLLRQGSILHDVGKIGVRESILLKPGALTAKEFAEIKKHPLIGERICQPLRSQPILHLGCATITKDTMAEDTRMGLKARESLWLPE